LSSHIANPAPARLGLGFDRWFVFLGKLGVSHMTLTGIFSVLVAGLVLSAVSLRGTLNAFRQS
jgi:hypothetical protein